jgi:hypothetical protein
MISSELGNIVEGVLSLSLGQTMTQGVEIPIPGFLGFKNAQVQAFSTHFLLTSELDIAL